MATAWRSTQTGQTDLRPQPLRQVRLVSRLGKGHTCRFPGLVEAVRTLRARTLVLDGEVARYDQQLISPFEWLRADPGDELATPPMLTAASGWRTFFRWGARAAAASAPAGR